MRAGPDQHPLGPPSLDGHSCVRLLGRGGHADVYLYQRELPRMLVAVKVLAGGDLEEDAGRRLAEEAEDMARLAAHPHIVPIIGAGVADDGRPYIVMAYYPGEALLARSTRCPLAVVEALRCGIQLAGALETAHRAGIVHRDVKPANVLTDEFGNPGLTDFGVAAARASGAPPRGVSIPWSPPEALEGGGAGDVRSDVYSLAATVYSLLAGRSPFEDEGPLPPGELMERIERLPLPAIGREDVPRSLERALANAMSRRPEMRPGTAVAFARDLQEVEQALRVRMTAVVVPGADGGRAAMGTDPTRTRVRAADRVHGP